MRHSARAILPTTSSLNIIRWTILNERTVAARIHVEYARIKRGTRERMSPCARRGRRYVKLAPILLRSSRGAPIRFEFKPSDGRRTPDLVASFKRIRADWLPPPRTIPPEPVWPSNSEDQRSIGLGRSCSTLRGPARSRTTVRGIGKETSQKSQADQRKLRNGGFARSSGTSWSGRTGGVSTLVASYSPKRRSVRIRTSNWKTEVPGELLARLLSVRWKHNKFPKCWQPRFVTKSTIQYCPVRPWPREYHAVSLAGRTRGRPLRCSRRR